MQICNGFVIKLGGFFPPRCAITYLPVDPDETMLPAEEPRQASVDVALAAAPVTAEPVEAIPAKASNPLGSLIAVGVLSLAGLAAALYKVI